MATGSGDPFSALLRPHLDRLYRLAFRLTGTRSDAEDLLQDVLTRLYTRRDELSSIENLTPWLGRVLYNRFVDDQRRYQRRRVHVVDGHHDPDLAPGVESDHPDVRVERDRNVMALTKALDRLSDDHRITILLHDAEGYSLREIQTLTGVPLGTLKSRLHRARQRLRELMKNDGTLSHLQTCRYSEGARIDAM